MVNAGGGVEEALWLELDEAGRTLGNFCLYLGKMSQACIRSVVLYGSETWAAKEVQLAKLERNVMVVPWMCNVTEG